MIDRNFQRYSLACSYIFYHITNRCCVKI